MRQKLIIAIILLALTALLWAFKSGVFESTSDDYVTMKMPEVVDYNFHIKPILSDNCYTCHGPDANKRKAGLRLDIADNAFAELPESPGKFAIVQGKPNQSEIYLNIVSDDSNVMMPPPDSQLKLKPHEKELIQKWIEQGGKFEKHWAYIPPIKKEIPTTENLDWGNNEIDGFVLEKLKDNNLTPSEKAPTKSLLRRISLDLTGLPPKQETVDRLLKNDSADIIPTAIDEFLALPAYGERMTQSWLDLARYADSHGYQDDSYRTMWPWRDWVIHAFNKNLPYDEFLTWQLAGDLLPNATKEQVLATGFNRNHPITQEGGVIQEEYRTNYVLDRTNTLGKGILGLTLECARCHDHKYDAISQKNYYEFFSFFNYVNEQ